MNKTMKDKTRKYQLVIFGATGFTGQIATNYIDQHYPNIKYAIAGRNQKLNNLADSCKNNEPDVLIGDSHNTEALNQIAASTNVVLSFAGPFNKYSNLMVECCLRSRDLII